MGFFVFNKRPVQLRPALNGMSDLVGLVKCVPPTELTVAFHDLVKTPTHPTVKLFTGDRMNDLLLNFRDQVVGEFFFGTTKKDKWVFYKFDQYEFEDGKKRDLVVLASSKETHILTNTPLPVYTTLP